MSLSLIGTLPVSALNIGLAAAPAALGVEISNLQADVAKFTGALTTQLQVSATFPPNLAGYATAFAAALDPTAVASAFNPANWVTLNADANTQLVADLAALAALLAILEPIMGDFSAGLSAGGLASWSYAGRASGFGTSLDLATRYGIAEIPGATQVSAVVIATNAFASWQSFGQGMNVGASSAADIGQAPTSDGLAFLGSLSGARVNTGTSGLFARLSRLLDELHGKQASLRTQIDLSLGIGLPDPTDVVNTGLSVDLTAALGNLVSVQADLAADIGTLNAAISATTALSGGISTQLSAGGLSLWSYSGPLSALGASLASALAPGLPGVNAPTGPAYGLAIACSAPTAWAGFSRIFKTS